MPPLSTIVLLLNVAYSFNSSESELCSHTSNWTVLSGNGTFKNCKVDRFEGEAIISDKKWYDEINESLFIDYIYSVQFDRGTNKSNNQHSGVTIYQTLCHSYYISINAYNVSITQQTEDKQNVLISVPLMFVYRENEFYELSIHITNQGMFDISVDDIHHISFMANATFLNGDYSNFIGIRSENVITSAKSLSVSGNDTDMKLNLTMKCHPLLPQHWWWHLVGMIIIGCLIFFCFMSILGVYKYRKQILKLVPTRVDESGLKNHIESKKNIKNLRVRQEGQNSPKSTDGIQMDTPKSTQSNINLEVMPDNMLRHSDMCSMDSNAIAEIVQANTAHNAMGISMAEIVAMYDDNGCTVNNKATPTQCSPTFGTPHSNDIVYADV